jgi:amidophosphoribosyltransferase
MEGLIAATTIAEDKLCTACFTGTYPISVPSDMSEGKMRLEITEKVNNHEHI